MKKEAFADFLDILFKYDFKADIKCITPKVRINNTLISINFVCSDDFIEYDEYTHKEFKREFENSLIEDGFINEKKQPLEKVEDISLCEVWLNLTSGYDIYASVHLWDFSDEGQIKVGTASNY